LQNGDLPDAAAAALFDVRHIGKVPYTRFGAKKRSVSYRPEALSQICLLFSVALVVAINFRLAEPKEAGCIVI
jgi:hypothetical protein